LFFRKYEKFHRHSRQVKKIRTQRAFFREAGAGAKFSGPVSVFHDGRLPESAVPAGYAALIDAYKVLVQAPRTLSAIGTKHRIIEQGGWRIYTPRHAPQASLEGHLTFALKNEGVDLAVLKRLFLAVKEEDVAELVRQKPTGIYTRRIWFLYEWLLGRALKLLLADKVSYVDAVDTDLQFGGAGHVWQRVAV
jgi:hypothetical protein